MATAAGANTRVDKAPHSCTPLHKSFGQEWREAARGDPAMLPEHGLRVVLLLCAPEADDERNPREAPSNRAGGSVRCYCKRLLHPVPQALQEFHPVRYELAAPASAVPPANATGLWLEAHPPHS